MPTTNPTPYIVRRAPYNGVKVKHFIAERLFVSRIDETRDTGRNLGGLFREVESTGRKVKGILRINTGRDGTTDGHGAKRGHSEHVRIVPAAEIKKVVRRMRPEEVALIADVDAVIDGLEERLKEARRARAELVATAWTKAHTVTAKELEALADMKTTSEYALSEEDRKAAAAANDEIRRAFST